MKNIILITIQVNGPSDDISVAGLVTEKETQRIKKVGDRWEITIVSARE
jgi:hypothetical protein